MEDYLNKFTTTNGATSSQTSTSVNNLRDDEQALLLLLQCGNNSDEALRRRRLGVGAIPPNNKTSIWSEEECRNFENGIKLYGKCFHDIQASKVNTNI